MCAGGISGFVERGLSDHDLRAGLELVEAVLERKPRRFMAVAERMKEWEVAEFGDCDPHLMAAPEAVSSGAFSADGSW